jgi:hypothetical protein
MVTLLRHLEMACTHVRVRCCDAILLQSYGSVRMKRLRYVFGRLISPGSHIEAPGFDPAYHNTSFTAGKMIALMTHMNWIVTVMRALPEFLALKLGEGVSASVRLKRVSRCPLYMFISAERRPR